VFQAGKTSQYEIRAIASSREQLPSLQELQVREVHECGMNVARVQTMAAIKVIIAESGRRPSAAAS